ncbi:amino acid ABC transporter permease [Campylobacter fetus subsp. venerealis]|uniref:amino acid ABC transporter permease n=1 Tax=Campylobacter fetus TaxID=196 RepID=UPI0018E7E8E4|nr:amino acid ABC transporter permease [Campylobacter fetus]QQF51935.1 amino acid ABC transporter permease [Campylobacter fetus subsp. venerealis]
MEAVLNYINLKNLLYGLSLTLIMAFFAAVGSIIFGSILAVMRNYGNKFIRGIAGAYVEIYRNTPLLLWMYAGCFVLPTIFSFLQGFSYAVLGTIGLFLYTSSVMSEIIRGGLNSIPKGQFEAAASQGFGFFYTLYKIIFPQTIKKVTPAILSQAITTVKDTSFMAGLGVYELTNQSKLILASLKEFSHILAVIGLVAAMYFIVCFSLSIIVRYYNTRTTY